MLSVPRSSGNAAVDRIALYAYQHRERVANGVTASRAGKILKH